jgi:hypothetical protein
MATHSEVFEAILAARGGRSAFTTETLACASALAHASMRAADGDAAAATSLAALAALLPRPVGAPGAPDERLPRLNNTELPVLEFLLERLDGRDEPDEIAEVTWWDRCRRVERDLAAAEQRIAEFARLNETLHNELKALRPEAIPDEALEVLPPELPQPAAPKLLVERAVVNGAGDGGPACDTSHWGRW